MSIQNEKYFIRATENISMICVALEGKGPNVKLGAFKAEQST